MGISYKINVFWKMYAWIFLVICFLGFIVTITTIGYNVLFDTVSLVIDVISFIGIFGYVYHKKIIRWFPWKIFVIISILWNMLELFTGKIITELGSGDITAIPSFILSITIVAPSFVALYFYSFKFLYKDSH